MLARGSRENPLEEKPLVSVIIATHDRAQLVKQALASVYAQEGLDEEFEMEVIVVDDASSDSTPEVVRAYPGARYIRLEKNLGEAGARNVGIQASKGAYVAFLDDDDLWLPYKLRMQVPVLQASPKVGVVYSQQIVSLGNQVSLWPDTRLAHSGSVFQPMLMYGFTSVDSVLVRRETFEKAGYFDESTRGWVDYDLWLRLAFHFPFQFVPGPVAIYRLSGHGIYLGAANEGNSERVLRHVIDRALSLLPVHEENYDQISREARARVGLRVAEQLEMIGELGRMQDQILKTLHEFPWIAGESWARSWIAWKVCCIALASDAPLDAVRAFCARARDAIGRNGIRNSLRTRGMLADAWKQVAIGLAKDPRANCRAAGHAATYAILNSPKKFGRSLLRVMARAVFSSQANSMAASKASTAP